MSPRFQPATRLGTGPLSQSAERALVNQRSLLHARQAGTASSVGAPQRAHSGRASARICGPHSSHIHSPGRRQAAQRRGRARRMSEASDGMAPG
jgi:hypothetical protein